MAYLDLASVALSQQSSRSGSSHQFLHNVLLDYGEGDGSVELLGVGDKGVSCDELLVVGAEGVGDDDLLVDDGEGGSVKLLGNSVLDSSLFFLLLISLL